MDSPAEKPTPSQLVASQARALICDRKYEELEKLFASFPQPDSLIHAVHVSILGETVGAGNFQKACLQFQNLLGEDVVSSTLASINPASEKLPVKCRLNMPPLHWEWFDPTAPLFFQHFAVLVADRLRGRKQYQPAAEILEEVCLLMPNNPFALACLLEVRTEAGEILQAKSILSDLKQQLKSKNEADATFFKVAILCYDAELAAAQHELEKAKQFLIDAMTLSGVQSFYSELIKDWSNETDALTETKERIVWAKLQHVYFNYHAALCSLTCLRDFHNRYGSPSIADLISRFYEQIEQHAPMTGRNY